MSVQVTIEAASKAEAELIAQKLPVRARVQSWRGLGVIRLGRRSPEETDDFIEAVSQSFQQHKLQWARVRYDDEERVFKANGHRPR
jgi:histidinol-phosphate/aromatic aminotransferase/cobyric acid decarboxylase-like protein